MELLNKVEMTIRGERLAGAGDKIVVAVSGGPDSMALLHVLFLLSGRIGFELTTAHVNHGFRPEASKREAETVAAYSASLGVPCDVARFDLPAYIAATGMNAQAAARKKRYAFLFETAALRGANKIALAHHADDQAETVLMRLMRGTGPSGLTGIPIRRTEKKMELIRPLLRIYKSEIERHCADCGVPVCRDESNGQRKYFRNAVRLDVLPFLQQYNDKLPEALNRLADMMRAEDDWMEAEARRKFAELVTIVRAEGRIACAASASRFAGLHVALQRRLIKLILEYVFAEADLSDYARIEAVRAAFVRESGESLSLDLHDRLKLIREYDLVRFVLDPAPSKPYEYIMRLPGQTLMLPEAGVELESALVERMEIIFGPRVWNESGGHREAYFDFDVLSFPLAIRSRRPGDRMEPLGLKGTKKVKDMFIDEKVPPAARDVVPIVQDAAGRILWIPGVRRSAHATVSETTSKVLVMKVRSV